MMLSIADENPTLYLLVLVAIVGSIVLHELGHAIAADRQGDPTPRMLGHFTWNPVVHMGWVSIFLAATIGIAFGRTPVTPRNFRNKRFGDAIVSFAGPLVNLLLAVFAAFCLAGTEFVFGAAVEGGAGKLVRDWWLYVCVFNCLLFVFNLIPVPPFDGFNVAKAFIRFGQFEYVLRRAHPIPLVLVFVAAWQGWFEPVYFGLTRVLILAAKIPFELLSL